MKKSFSELIKFLGSKFSLFVLGSIISITLVYINTYSYGIGISADSINYLSIAKNISKNFSFVTSITEWNYYGSEYWNGYWPPLYPILLILPALAGSNLAFIIFNGFLLSITFFLSFKILERIHPGHKGMIFLAVLLIVISKWIIWIFCFLFSETIFIPLVLGYLILLDNLISDRNDQNYIRILVITCLLSMTRYIGIFFFIPIVLFTLPSFYLFRLKRIIYFVLSVIPFLVILIINYIKTSKLFGVRAQNNNTFLGFFSNISEGISKWILGAANNYLMDVVISIVFAAIVFLSLIAALRFGKGINKLIVVTSAVYLLAIISSALTERLEKFGFRFISPIFIPVALVIVSSLLNLRKKFLFAVLILSLTLSSIVLFRFVKSNQVSGIGVFANKEWKSSETIKFLIANEAGKEIYSNYAEPIYFYTGHPTKILADEKEKIDSMFEKIRREHAIIAIIYSKSRPQLETLELIIKEADKQTQISFADGVVYYF